MKFCKNLKKELLLFLFYFQCMNVDVDACVRERRKRALSDLEVVALVDLLCLMFYVLRYCCHFYCLSILSLLYML